MAKKFLVGKTAKSSNGSVYSVVDIGVDIVTLRSNNKHYMRFIRLDENGDEYVLFSRRKGAAVIYPMC